MRIDMNSTDSIMDQVKELLPTAECCVKFYNLDVHQGYAVCDKSWVKIGELTFDESGDFMNLRIIS